MSQIIRKKIQTKSKNSSNDSHSLSKRLAERVILTKEQEEEEEIKKSVDLYMSNRYGNRKSPNVRDSNQHNSKSFSSSNESFEEGKKLNIINKKDDSKSNVSKKLEKGDKGKKEQEAKKIVQRSNIIVPVVKNKIPTRLLNKFKIKFPLVSSLGNIGKSYNKDYNFIYNAMNANKNILNDNYDIIYENYKIKLNSEEKNNFNKSNYSLVRRKRSYSSHNLYSYLRKTLVYTNEINYNNFNPESFDEKTFIMLKEIFSKPSEKRTINDLTNSINYLRKTDLLPYLSKQKIFKENINNLLTMFGYEMTLKQYNENELIFNLGDSCNYLYILLSGKLNKLVPVSYQKILSGNEYFRFIVGLINDNEAYLLRQTLKENQKIFPLNFENIDELPKIILFMIIKFNYYQYIDLIDLLQIKPKDFGLDENIKLNDKKYIIANRERILGYIPNYSNSALNNYFFIFSNSKAQATLFKKENKETFLPGCFFGMTDIDKEKKREYAVSVKTKSNILVVNINYYAYNIKKELKKIFQDEINFLQENFIFKIIPKSRFEDKYFGLFEYENKKKGDIIFKEGEKAQYCYFIRKGKIDLLTKKSLLELHVQLEKLSKYQKNSSEELYHTNLKTDFEEINKEFDKKYNKKIYSLHSKETLGLESIFYEFPYLYTAVVSSLNLKLIKIKLEYLKEIFHNENFALVPVKELADGKIETLYDRFININKATINQVDSRKYVESFYQGRTKEQIKEKAYKNLLQQYSVPTLDLHSSMKKILNDKNYKNTHKHSSSLGQKHKAKNSTHNMEITNTRNNFNKFAMLSSNTNTVTKMTKANTKNIFDENFDNKFQSQKIIYPKTNYKVVKNEEEENEEIMNNYEKLDRKNKTNAKMIDDKMISNLKKDLTNYNKAFFSSNYSDRNNILDHLNSRSNAQKLNELNIKDSINMNILQQNELGSDYSLNKKTKTKSLVSNDYLVNTIHDTPDYKQFPQIKFQNEDKNDLLIVDGSKDFTLITSLKHDIYRSNNDNRKINISSNRSKYNNINNSNLEKSKSNTTDRIFFDITEIRKDEQTTKNIIHKPNKEVKHPFIYPSAQKKLKHINLFNPLFYEKKNENFLTIFANNKNNLVSNILGRNKFNYALRELPSLFTHKVNHNVKLNNAKSQQHKNYKKNIMEKLNEKEDRKNYMV